MKWSFSNKQNLKSNRENTKAKRSKLREWFDAILFAVIVSTFIRGLLFSAYAIPTASMEGTQLVGDYLFVSKIAYGPRMPITPISIPFLESTIGRNQLKTYWDGLQLAYFRLPGIGQIKRGDVVVFNYPPEAGAKPVDMRTHYIKRCQAVPGDVISIVDSKVYVNGRAMKLPAESQTSYTVHTNGESLNPELLRALKVEIRQQFTQSDYEMIMPVSSLENMKSRENILSVKPVIVRSDQANSSLYPQNEQFKWTEDNYGPITIPRKGWTVPLNDSTLALYRNVIEAHELNEVSGSGNYIYINKEKSDTYTFKSNYYWMMGDNRHNSLDSRYWGFVPEDHIVGKAMFTWMSIDHSENLLKKVRWNRIFKSIQ